MKFFLFTISAISCYIHTIECYDSQDDTLPEYPKWKNENFTEENVAIMEQKLNSFKKSLFNTVAYRGDALRDYRIGLRELNLLTRENYAEMIERVGHNVYPLLVATDVNHDKRLSGVGSEWILYVQNGSIYTSKPTPAAYEGNKDLAHIAMGIFSIISPYFNHPTSNKWHDKLKEYQKTLKMILSSLEDWNLNITTPTKLCDENLTKEDQKNMLTSADQYIDNCFKTNSVNYVDYQKFTDSLLPIIYKAMICSVQAQIRATKPQLEKWKQLLGEEWNQLYVLIPVIWPIARINVRRQIIETLMEHNHAKTNIIMAEGAQSIKEARITLGRIISDRVLSQLVFSHNSERDLELNLAMSTKIDVVTPDAYHELNRKIQSYVVGDEPNDLRYMDSF